MEYLCLCISIYEQSLMDVLWCYRMDDGGGHCDIDQMLASQLAAPTLYFHSGLGQELLHNTFWGCNVCVWRIFMEILQQQQKSLFKVHWCWAEERNLETFDISDGFGELVNFLIGLMEFLCSITLFIPQTVMEVPGPGDNARIIHSHKVRKPAPSPSHPSGLSEE